MNFRRFIFVQAIGDAFIPLIALLFFEWGLYFILLYYFLDLIISEIIIHIKIQKVLRFRKGHAFYKPELRKGALLSMFLMISFIGICHIALAKYSTPINFSKELIAFLQYKELGIPIPQWALLVPILLLANYQQYQMIFIRQEQFRFLLPTQLMESKLRQNIILFIVSLIMIPIIAFLQLDQTVIAVFAIIGKFLYDIKYRV